MDFHLKIKQLRKSVGWSQGDLARVSGFSIRSINSWETGERIPKERNFNEIERTCLTEQAKLLSNTPLGHSPIDKAEEPQYTPKTSHTLEQEDDMRDYLKVFKELLRMKDEEIERLKAEISLNELKKDSQGEGF